MPSTFRSNRKIDGVLRRADKKYDRTKETQGLLRRYLV
jgi:hypothetical protein